MIRRVVLLLAVAACSKSTPATTKGGKLEYPVQCAPVAKRQVQYAVTAPGSIEAFQQVQITARVAGAVDKVSFVEGQDVKLGDVLVVIESERYQVAVDSAKAGLTKAQANQKSQESELARRQNATSAHPGLIPGEEIDTHATGVETAKADVETAKQTLHVAELNLRDSYVKAPIAGVVQTRTVQAGQYLQPGAVLATILQRDPMILRFQVSEQDAPRLKNGMVANLVLRESPRNFTAKITLVAGAADAQTRLVPVTAQLDETEHQYWLRPGAFCEVNVPIDAPRQAIVVPTMAVRPSEKGNMVYVVDAKNVARSKIVDLGMHTPDGDVEVTHGLDEGEQLVVRGVEPLTDGAPVKVTEHTTLEGFHDAGPHQDQAQDNNPTPGATPAGSHSGGGGGHRKQQ
jgi:RND family efflux transporter MFP subunit